MGKVKLGRHRVALITICRNVYSYFICLFLFFMFVCCLMLLFIYLMCISFFFFISSLG